MERSRRRLDPKIVEDLERLLLWAQDEPDPTEINPPWRWAAIGQAALGNSKATSRLCSFAKYIVMADFKKLHSDFMVEVPEVLVGL